MTEQVVAGWDGTAAASKALDWAIRHDPDVRHVKIVTVEDSSRAARPNADADPEQAAARIRAARPAVEVQVAGVRGPAEDVLVGHTAPGTLLVLGAQDPADRLYGHRSSLAYRVGAAARGRVAVVPLSHDHGRGVVVGLVKPGESPAAVLAAADEAAARRQRLIGVHAWRRLLDIDVFDLDPSHKHDADDRHAKQMDAMLAPAVEAHPTLEITRRVVHGRAEDVLRAQSVGAALLVIGRDDVKDERRRRGTMQTVLLTSLIPVLVVPPTAA